MLFFLMFYLSKNPEKVFQVQKKTNDNKSECFLKDHVTLKTGVMTVENLALHHRNNISQIYFDQINAALMSKRYFFKKH